jgi:hypothetical membrane protein
MLRVSPFPPHPEPFAVAFAWFNILTAVALIAFARSRGWKALTWVMICLTVGPIFGWILLGLIRRE